MEKKKISKSETVWLSISGFFFVGGLFFGVIGIIERYLATDNWISKTLSALNGFFGWSIGLGVYSLILMLIGLVIYLSSTLTYAKRVDIASEKRARRAQRLHIEASAAADEETKVVDAEVVSEK